MRQPSIIKAPQPAAAPSRNASQRNSCSASSFNQPTVVKSDSRNSITLTSTSCDARDKSQLLEKVKGLKQENKNLLKLLKDSEKVFYQKL